MVIDFLQKTNKQIQLYYYDTSGGLVFVPFMEKIDDPKNRFEISLPLGSYYFSTFADFSNFIEPMRYEFSRYVSWAWLCILLVSTFEKVNSLVVECQLCMCARTTDTQREFFFSKIRNFWAWADKLG